VKDSVAVLGSATVAGSGGAIGLAPRFKIVNAETQLKEQYLKHMATLPALLPAAAPRQMFAVQVSSARFSISQVAVR
jgi:hypothetical protein